MVKKLITVELASGLEARPAAMLVQVASQYESAIYLAICCARTMVLLLRPLVCPYTGCMEPARAW